MNKNFDLLSSQNQIHNQPKPTYVHKEHKGMSNYRSFATTRTGRKRVFYNISGIFSKTWKIWIFFFSHPMDFSWSTNMGYMTCSLNAWGIYISAICIPDYGCHLCFASPPQLWVHLRATSGRILMDLFFRRHGNTRVLDMSFFSQSNIFEHNDFYYFKLKWHL